MIEIVAGLLFLCFWLFGTIIECMEVLIEIVLKLQMWRL